MFRNIYKIFQLYSKQLGQKLQKLTGNKFGAEGCKAMSAALKKNKTLEQLEMRCEIKENKNIQKETEAVTQLK